MKETINDELKIKDIDAIEKISGESLDIVKENVKKLKEIFPEVFCEDKIDFKRLEEVLGEYTDNSDERYRFEWHGKSKAIKLSQTPSKGTLRPCKEESKNWDTTENLYIEGDNLEVLKLLQKSYQGKIKMIYIDPPYNTGNDFIYPDDYSDNLENYLKITEQKDNEGNKISTNSETDGRYHTNWLNMMYPRLRLARNLLKNDGVIFVSIDDKEIENLIKIGTEIFGENNFVAIFTWRRTDNQPNIGNMARVKEYIVCFCKKKENFYFDKLPLTEKAMNEYRYCDEKGKFRRKILLDKTRGRYRYDVTTKNGKILNGPWMIKEEEFKALDKNGAIYWTQSGEEQPYGKLYLTESKGQIPNDFLGIEYGTNQRASIEVEKLFNKRLFEFPKPVSLIKTFLSFASNKNEFVLDFFSGSSTTAHAVMKLNAEDKGKRKFIMVQLPEECDEKSEAYKAGYKNICEIGKERIRRAGDKIVEENKDKEGIDDLDIGFKVFKLDKSNIKPWNPDYDNLEMTLEDSINNFVQGRTEEDILYEIMLKYGIDLTYPVDVKEICGKKLFSVGFGALIVCLDSDITLELVNEIIKYKNELNPKTCRVVFRDNGFKTDSVKTNAIETLHRNNIKEIMSI